MILIGLLFVCALGLSAAAGFYSIAGLTAIFAAAPISIIIMGSLLEGSKLVIASWLYRNWTDAPILMKGYLTAALVILMALTSMGIFGYLSKAHIEQGVPTAGIATQLQIIDQKIAAEQSDIALARQTLAQLDEQVNQTLSRTASATNDSGVRRSIAIRRAQASERQQLAAEIEQSQQAIAQLTDQRIPLNTSIQQVEAKVGPLKYIAATIYGDAALNDPTLLEKAVRWVTIIIVAVFDPLAVILLIAANWSLAQRKKVVAPTTPVYNTPNEPAPESDTMMSQPETPKAPVIPAYLQRPFVHFKNLKPMVAPRPGSVQNTEPANPVAAPSIPQQWGSRPPNHLDPIDPRRR